MSQIELASDSFAASIMPDVLAALVSRSFFEVLEPAVFPDGDSGPRSCDHTFARTQRILSHTDLNTPEELEDILAVLRSKGGFCDCEVIYHVDPRVQSLRSPYWKARTTQLEETR